MIDINKRRAENIKAAVSDLRRTPDNAYSAREVIEREISGTKLPAEYVRDTLIPAAHLGEDEPPADIDYQGLDDLIDSIRRSDEVDLSDVADEWDLERDIRPNK